MVELEKVTKVYRKGNDEIRALRGVDLQIGQGEFVVLCGPSGSGKTTLLMTMAGMLRPTTGEIRIEGNNLYQMRMRERAEFRAQNIGFVFQMFHLIAYLNVVENVLVAGGTGSRGEQRSRAEKLLEKVGLAERGRHRPGELSAGEKQRAAIVRALFNRPKLILADEPTGNLDPDNAVAVLEHLSEFHRSGGTVVVATHGPTAERFADRVVYLRQGSVDRTG
jgi:putative ABC transport system ATP-binding protein